MKCLGNTLRYVSAGADLADCPGCYMARFPAFSCGLGSNGYLSARVGFHTGLLLHFHYGQPSNTGPMLLRTTGNKSFTLNYRLCLEVLISFIVIS